MNLMSLKAVVFDEERNGFYSPQKKDFVWPTGIVASSCVLGRCDVHTFNEDCTCGLYSSPNPQALVEYSQANNAVFVLLNTYGWSDIWSAPSDIRPAAHVLRSWGAQIVGIVNSAIPDYGLKFTAARQLSAFHGAEYYGTKLFPWSMAKAMIKTTWRVWSKVIVNPYSAEE